MQYVSTIVPFKRRHDGRGALRALKAPFVGSVYWDKQVKLLTGILTIPMWMGTSTHTLYAFLAKHWLSYHQPARFVENDSVKIPNAHTRVRYLLSNIKCTDKGVAAALAGIRLVDGPGVMR